MSAADSSTTIDDARVRVTTWTFADAGVSTGQHVHEYDYIVVPVTGGSFRVTDANGTVRELTQRGGTPYQGKAGTAHDVENVGLPAIFVEIELKA
jgi:quercetin dioxygenase-like cupin family protein